MIPGPEDVPECIEKIDAAIHWDHDPEYVYLFAGDWYYRLVIELNEQVLCPEELMEH